MGKPIEEKVKKPVNRRAYLVVHAKNFGKGKVPAGQNVQLSDKAAEFYLDQGIIKTIKK